MRLISHILKLKLPVFVFLIPKLFFQYTAFLDLKALPLLSVFKETTAHTPANTARASHCSLPRNQAATVFYKMFFVFDHAPLPCSFNKQN